MGFLPHGNCYILKGDVPNEEFEDAQDMPEVDPIVGSSSIIAGSSSSMEENIANMCRRMEKTYTLQGSKHDKVCSLI